MHLIGSEPSIPNDLFLKAMSTCSSATSVEELSIKNSKLIGFKAVSYHHLPNLGSADFNKMGRYIATGLSDSVITYIDSHRAQDDPIMNYVMSKGRPFWLSKLKKEPHQWSETASKRIEIALTFMGDGILVPLYGPFHNSAYNYISFEKPTKFYDDVFIWQIQALLQAIHVKYCFIRESLQSKIKLTPRENDVLELITFGKTNPQISELLGISTNTVTGYVKQIYLKLGVSDRVSAALRARNYHMGY